MPFPSSTIEAHKQAHVDGSLRNNQPKSARKFTLMSEEDAFSLHSTLYKEAVDPRPTNSDFLLRTDFIDSFLPKTQARSKSLRGPREMFQRIWHQPVCFPQRPVWELPRRPETLELEPRRSRRPEGGKESPGTPPNQRGSRNPLPAAGESSVPETGEARPGQPLLPRGAQHVESLSSDSSFLSPSSHSSYSTLTTVSRTVELQAEPDVIISPADCSLELSPSMPCILNSPVFRREMPTCLLTVEAGRNIFEILPKPPNISPPPAPPPPPPPLPPPPPFLPLSTPPSPPSSSPSPLLPSLPSLPPPSPPLPSPLSPPSWAASTTCVCVPVVKHTVSVTPTEDVEPSVAQLPASTSVCDTDPQKQPKGILKHIKNLADLEKSVANMYSQIEKNFPATHSWKLETSCPPERENVDVTSQQPQGNLHSFAEETENQSHSQSTSL
ncbi:protocadherin-15-like [Canis lupus dingo]|nr:protocadherin-15-like [Canis lupus dingo]